LERFHQNLDSPHTVQEKGLGQQLKTPANPKKTQQQQQNHGRKWKKNNKQLLNLDKNNNNNKKEDQTYLLKNFELKNFMRSYTQNPDT